MRFDGLVPGTLIRRYKRFLADVRLTDGTVVIAHSTNTGRMTGCSDPGSRVWLSRASNPKRKLKWTWELVEVAPGVLLGVNTFLANRLAQEAIEAGLVPGLERTASIEREVKLDDTMRADLRVDGRCWVEIKNLTLAAGTVGQFPDAPTTRGQKHLAALTRAVGRGEQAMLLHLVLRPDIEVVEPADHVDPGWGVAIRRAAAAGVQILAVGADVSPEAIIPARRLPVRL
jgi:sugar fermentation stimulation protein A